MPVQTTYPGVYIEEIPCGVRTITGVATSIAAFIGRARSGPKNDPVVITTIRAYGRSLLAEGLGGWQAFEGSRHCCEASPMRTATLLGIQ
jgi:phage tail sheath protein FI